MFGGAAVARSITPNLAVLIGGVDNLPAFLSYQRIPGTDNLEDPLAATMVFIFTWILCTGIKESTVIQSIFTMVNTCPLMFVIVVGSYLGFKSGWVGYELPTGYFPFGIDGMVAGSATAFFAYIGFDAVASTAEEGKYRAMAVCFILGLGSLVSWNSMLTIGDYYYQLFPKYHPSRVLTLVYQPFAIGTLVVMTHYESKINTRLRNVVGFILFFVATFLIIILDLATSGKGGIGTYLVICFLSACFGVADAFVQGGMVGDLYFMCPEFVQSFLAGLAASGALISLLSANQVSVREI